MRGTHQISDKENWSDEELWERMLHKDDEAVSLLYQRYFDFLYNYGLHVCADEDVVKDCIQDLFLSLFSLHSTAPIRSVKAYLLMSMRNNLLASLKERGGYSRVEELEFELSVSEEDFFHCFGSDDQTKERLHKLQQAYGQLNANQRHAIYLRFIKELDWNELGEVLNISPHSGMNLVGRALAKLRTMLGSIVLF